MRSIVSACVVVMLFGVMPVHAGESRIELEAAIHRLAVFKNGFALVHRRAALPAEGTRFRVRDLHAGTFGSFWIEADGGVELTHIRARQAMVHAPVSVRELRTMLGNAAVDIDLGDGIITRRIEQPVLDFDIKNGTGTFSDKNVPVPFIDMIALRQGIAWSPSYRLNLLDDTRATVTGKCILVNDLDDLREARIELIAGYPHLQFASVNSALNMQSLSALLNELRSGGNRLPDTSVLSNVMVQAVAYQRAAPGSPTAAGPSMPATAVMGEGR